MIAARKIFHVFHIFQENILYFLLARNVVINLYWVSQKRIRDTIY